MTPHERELILGVADQLRAADRSAVDPEAERLIRGEVASQPNAAYLLTQRVIVQELALRQAQARINELEGKTGGSGRSFLGGAENPARSPAGQQPGGASPAPAGGGGGGVGSFLKTAAAAAAGTIGGQLIYDGLRHLASGHLSGADTGGLLGGASSGGFLSGGSRDTSPDLEVDSPRGRNQDWGGGGDFGTDQAEVVEDADDQDEDEVEDDDSSEQDDWADDGDDNADDGGGGSW